jgi:NADH-quinone oxidoreductase subunit N
MIDFSFNALTPIFPELLMAVSAMAVLLIGLFSGKHSYTVSTIAALVAVITAGVLVFQGDPTRVEILKGMFVMDSFAWMVKLLLLGGIGVSLILSLRSMQEDGNARFEYPVLILLSGLGMMMMVSAHDLLALYVGLELQSLALYVLAAFNRDNAKSAESGMKYFVLGAISSGLLLFGASLIYGYTGTTNFSMIGHTLSEGLSAGALIGMVFVIAGISFKISAAPFHMWTPDVYEGAPTPVTAYFALVPKLAAIALLTRLLFEAFPAALPQWGQIVWLLAVLTMAVGSFAALMQNNIKRLLAYSSIGNMGFALVGLAAANVEGVASVLVYMVIYMIMTAGTFGIVLSMRRDGKALEQISDLSGLSRNSPALAYALAILMFSMSGIPPLAGFFGKFLVFKAAIGAGLYGLAVFGVLMSVVAAYYYLRVIKVMFFDEPVEKFDSNAPFTRRAVIAVSVVLVLVFILAPTPIMDAARNSVQSLIQVDVTNTAE